MSKEAVQKGKVIILSGPSGAGKTTLHDKLLLSEEFSGKVVRSISATTRPPRGNERHGRDYFFLSKKMFEYKARTGQFLEWARVFDRCYGTPLKNVRDLIRRGKSVLLCIDVQGGREVKRKIPQAITVFVKTPDLPELRRRLESRKTDSPESIKLRIQTARKELQQIKHYDHVIVNDRLDQAFRRLTDILRKELGGVCVR